MLQAILQTFSFSVCNKSFLLTCVLSVSSSYTLISVFVRSWKIKMMNFHKLFILSVLLVTMNWNGFGIDMVSAIGKIKVNQNAFRESNSAIFLFDVDVHLSCRCTHLPQL